VLECDECLVVGDGREAHLDLARPVSAGAGVPGQPEAVRGLPVQNGAPHRLAVTVGCPLDQASIAEGDIASLAVDAMVLQRPPQRDFFGEDVEGDLNA